MIAFLEKRLFALRVPLLCIAVVLAAIAFYETLPLSLSSTGLDRELPRGHAFTDTFHQYEGRFLGTNRIDIMLEAKSGTVWDAVFLKTYKALTDEVYLLPGVAQPTVNSLWSQNARYVRRTDDGYALENVIPPKADPDRLTAEMIAAIKENATSGLYVGHLVSKDSRAALVSAEILDRDPLSGRKLDYGKLASTLEEQIRARYDNASTSVAIIGYAPKKGAIAASFHDVFLFSALTLAVAALGLLFYAPSLWTGCAAVTSVAIALGGQLAFINRWGQGIDPLIFPAFFFTLGLSFFAAVEQLACFAAARGQGLSPYQSTQLTLRNNFPPLLPRFVVLLAAAAALYFIPIPQSRLLAASSIAGIVLTIIAVLIILPLAMSFGKGTKPIASTRMAALFDSSRWRLVLLLALILTAGTLAASHMQRTGSFSFDSQSFRHEHLAAPELSRNTRYNLDAAEMARQFPADLNDFVIVAELPANGCLDYPKLEFLNLFSSHMQNVQGVTRVRALPVVLKASSSRLNDGNLKWYDVPRGRDALARAVTVTPSRGLMLGPACSVLPLHIFLDDARPETIAAVIDDARSFIATHTMQDVQLRMASGNMGLAGAVNEGITQARTPMLSSIAAVFCIFLMIIFRDVRAVLTCLLPFAGLVLCAYMLLPMWNIELTPVSLPMTVLMLVLGMGFILAIHRPIHLHLEEGRNISESVNAALSEEAGPVLMTVLTMFVAVSIWIASPLKFQADMGVLCAIMLMAGMVAALILLPLWARAVETVWPRTRAPKRRRI